MGAFARMLNLGAVIEEQLYEVNVNTPEHLKEVGAKQAWHIICYS